MNNTKISCRKLYKGKRWNHFSTDELRKRGIAESHNMLFLGNINEKKFNFDKIKVNNSLPKKAKKSDYHTLYLCRSNESDRMKKERSFGKKQVRLKLKKETQDQIHDAFEFLSFIIEGNYE